MVALATVVVDDVEDYFDPGIVQSFNGSLETSDRLGGQKARVGGKVADRVVTPVIGEAALDQMAIVDRSLDRHQLDSGDPEIDEIIDHRRRSQAGEVAAMGRGDIRMPVCHAARMQFKDDRLFPRNLRAAIFAPSESRLD